MNGLVFEPWSRGVCGRTNRHHTILHARCLEIREKFVPCIKLTVYETCLLTSGVAVDAVDHALALGLQAFGQCDSGTPFPGPDLHDFGRLIRYRETTRYLVQLPGNRQLKPTLHTVQGFVQGGPKPF